MQKPECLSFIFSLLLSSLWHWVSYLAPWCLTLLYKMKIITSLTSNGRWNYKPPKNAKTPRSVPASYSISWAAITPVLKTVGSGSSRQKSDPMTSHNILWCRLSKILWSNSCWTCPVLQVSPPLPPHCHPHQPLRKQNALRNTWVPSLTHALLCHPHSLLLRHESVHLLKSPSHQCTLFSSLSSISKNKNPCLFWLWGFFPKSSS